MRAQMVGRRGWIIIAAAVQEVFGWSDDFAGATLMAFGGAAPEITISLVAVLGGDTGVGFGLVVGSALIAFGLIPPLCYFAVGAPLLLDRTALLRDTLAFLVALTMVRRGLQSNVAESAPVHEPSTPI